MSEKKYFSLIYGAKIEAAPNTKILPSDTFSELLTSKELLEHIKSEAEQYRQQVVSECEVLKTEAEKEGFAHGYQAWVTQLKNLESEIEKVRDDMQKLILPIALKTAKKIVANELTTSPETILSIVMSTLKTVAQNKKIVLYVNKADFEVLEKSKGRIKDLFEQLESLSIRERDDVEQGGCIIETEAGIINSQIKERWMSLEAAFQSLEEQLRKGTIL
ncbi:MAG: sctL [Chlamydiia bacterium]|nr:sctL [Chlamydiia bacterium]